MNVYICGDLHGDVYTIREFYNNHIKGTERESEEIKELWEELAV